MKKNIPKYQEIYNYLINEIKASNLKKDDKIPSENQLSEMFGISRITVQRALRELVNTGMIYRVRGGGTYVKGNDFEFSNNRIQVIPFIVANDSKYSRNYEVIQGAESYLKEHGFYMTLHVTNYDFENEMKIVNKLVGDGIKNLMIVPVETEKSFDFYYQLIKKQINIVFLGNLAKNLTANHVRSDNLTGGRIATEHLISLGHRRIACVSRFSLQYSSIEERYHGYRLAHTSKGLPINEDYVKFGHQDEGDIEHQISELLQMREPPTAIFALNDIDAIASLKALEQFNCKVPESMALIGFDNLMISANQPVPLSSIDPTFFETGYHAARIALEHRKHPEAIMQITLPVKLKARESTLGKKILS